MDENIQYYGIYYKNKLIAASSAEMDIEMKNAEMTDFATDPEFAGNSLSLILLRKMEEEMMRKEMKVLYTIARSFSPGMNITFAKQDYEFSGTLINNTNIFGKIESMNVWYKIISN
jgi:putative beta-lysine N-acetyltransferase